MVNGEVSIHRQMHNPTLLVVATVNNTIRDLFLGWRRSTTSTSNENEKDSRNDAPKAEEPRDSPPSSSLFNPLLVRDKNKTRTKRARIVLIYTGNH